MKIKRSSLLAGDMLFSFRNEFYTQPEKYVSTTVNNCPCETVPRHCNNSLTVISAGIPTKAIINNTHREPRENTKTGQLIMLLLHCSQVSLCSLLIASPTVDSNRNKNDFPMKCIGSKQGLDSL